MTTPEARYRRWRQTSLVAWGSIGVLVLLAIALWGIGKIAGALVPFVIAFIFVFLLNWPVRVLADRGMSRGVAAILCLSSGFVVFGALVVLAGPFVVRQVMSLVDSSPESFHQAEAIVVSLQERYADIAFPQWLGGFITATGTRLSELAVAFGDEVAGAVVATGGGVATAIFDLVLAVVIAFWALKDLPKLRHEMTALVGPKYEDDAEHLISTVTRVVGGYLRGQTLASLSTGLLATVGLAVIGVPYAFVLGLITTVFNYVPYVGPFAAGLIAALVGLIKGPWIALLAIVVIVVAQNVTDTLITPRVMSDQVDLHPTLVIFSLLVGGSLFGIPGMLFAIPVAATGKGLFVYYFEQRTQRQLASEDGALFRGSGCDDERTEPSDDDAGMA
ncbi:MAG: AI-2E family transporter [Coriobacteriia bacterium]|nr:AI-2E family transporter [Coriobacteriia bacterium]